MAAWLITQYARYRGLWIVCCLLGNISYFYIFYEYSKSILLHPTHMIGDAVTMQYDKTDQCVSTILLYTI
jgi:hypothetical protein